MKRRFMPAVAAAVFAVGLGAAFESVPAAAQSADRLLGNYFQPNPAADRQAWSQAHGLTGLPLWQRSYVTHGKTYSFEMVGSDPAAGSATTTIPVVIVPMKFIFSNGEAFDPSLKTQTLPRSAVKAFSLSTFFAAAPFKPGGTDVGKTQFIDAFQRANFWSDVQAHSPQYHVLLGGPKVMPTVSYNVPANLGSTEQLPNGIKYAVASSGWMGNLAIAYLQAHKDINSSMFVVFLTYNVEVGGGVSYHSSNGPQTYTLTMFNDAGVLAPLSQQFAKVADIQVSSHEIGEWLDDPFGSNFTPDGGLLEVGDTLQAHGFGARVNNEVFHMQELTFHDWFTCAKPSTSVNGWYSFLGTYLTPEQGC